MGLAALALGLTGCHRKAADGAPPRATDRIKVDDVPSLITVPVRADLGSLVVRLEREIPRTLWTIDKLLGKIARAIDVRREGDLVIRAEVTDTRTGRIRATGEGLYLPVRANGRASISLAD